MLASKSPDVPLEKMIFVPSGDHRGPKQPRDVGSGIGPPQAGCACTEIWCSPVPFLLTTKSASRDPRLNTSRLPSGDESPGMSSPPGVEVTRTKPPPSDE